MNDIITAATASTTDDTTDADETYRHAVADADMLVLPAGTTRGLTAAQIDDLRAAAVHAATEAPRLAPPTWAAVEDDGEDNHDGPRYEITPALVLHSSWCPDHGPSMWLDAEADPAPDLTPATARRLAAALVELADLIDGTGTPDVSEPGPGDDGDDDLATELEAYAATETLASRLPAPRPAPRMRAQAAASFLGDAAEVTR